MNWGDVPAWAGVIVALAFSYLAWQNSRKALSSQEGSAEAARRSAVAAEETLAEMKRIDAERRAAELAAAAPRVEMRVEYASKNTYKLRNVGTARATGVTVDPAEFGGFARQLPRGATLEPGEAVEILILSAWGVEKPTSFSVTWDGLSTAETVPMP